MDLEELKRLHDKAFNRGQVTREQASDDLVFYHVTQWDDNLLGESQLQYRGQFDILRKAGRKIMADLRENPIQVDFDPKDETRDDAADLIDGLYRKDDRNNVAVEAYHNAKGESVVAGVGAWVIHTEYESLRSTKQVIRRKPIYEACNNCYWDPKANLMDKSDADYVSILYRYSEEGYAELVKELTGEESNYAPNFAYPEQSYVFPWIAEDKKIYVTEFYHRKKVKDKLLQMQDMFGEVLTIEEYRLADVMDEMLDSGYEIVDEKDIERYEVTKYIASGDQILKEEVIAGENIPVVPVYGERAFVEGEEYYEGITRLAKDPQRLRNFQLSYLTDIVSRSPRVKPIYWPEQIQGYESMYEESGADNNYPYYLQNRLDANGEPLPQGPVAVMPEQPIPTALIQSIELSREAVDDVANAGVPQDVADPDASGKAIRALQASIDQQSAVYQENFKHAKRRDAEIYASMAKEIYDAPRDVKVTLPDGQTKTVQVMETVIDRETGDVVTINDLANSEFDVSADTGPNYVTRKEQTREEISLMIQSMPPDDPMRNVLMLKQAQLMDGVDFDDVRDYANRQLIIMGIKEPETPEEEQMLMQASQPQPDPNMVLAQAEMEKAKADQMNAQIDMVKTQADIQNNRAGTLIDMFDAETRRQQVQIAAQKAGAEINLKRIEQFNKSLDNELANQLRARAG